MMGPPVATKTEPKKGGVTPFGFRAPTALLKKTKAKAQKQSMTLGQIVHEVFAQYVASEPLGVNLSAREAALPRETASALRRLQEQDQQALNEYLHALNAAGWTLNSLAEILGMSRQAVFLRVKKAEGVTEGLPPVPVRSNYTRSKPVLAADDVTGFSVRMDHALHEQVRARARREGASITTVLTAGLERFVSGDLFPTAPDER